MRLKQQLETKLKITFVSSSKKGNEKKNYNPGHKILELHSVLVQVWFTTSKAELEV